jgi:phosphohistidine phosphatase
MKIYLMRHGDAATGPSGEPELTARGIEQATAIADWCGSQGIEFGGISHSSKLRARQTAEIMHVRVPAANGVEERSGLKPDDDPFAVAAFLESCDAPTLIVSHLPILDNVAGLLAENDVRRVVVGFATAQIACFSRNGESWTLDWTRRP